MSGLEIRGVPKGLETDAAWLDEPAPDGQDSPQPLPDENTAEISPAVWLTTAILVVIADLLFWKHPLGVSLIVYSATLTIAALLHLKPKLTGRDRAAAASLWVISALPVVEYLQLSSIALMVAGHLTVVTVLATRARGGALLRQTLLAVPAMVHFTGCALVAKARRRPRRPSSLKREALVAWILPGAVGLVFVVLFLQANPLLERLAVDLASFKLRPDTIWRIAFWGAAALVVLPFVVFRAVAPALMTAHVPAIKLPKNDGRVMNARSVTNSLFVFNILFFLQNATDVAVLWGGAALPEGVTYAEYAYQGAYPLMVTSVLAGLFMLVSQRFVAQASVLRVLLLLWVAQNVVLAVSAFGRLDLYMYAYGLSYLRIRAAIGMGLVLAGMLLLGWQLWSGKGNSWTIARFAGLVVVALYIGSFVNFGHLIVSTNLAREDGRIDYRYICDIGPLGAKALSNANASPCRFAQDAFAPQSWRDWSWRKARLNGYAPITVLSARDISRPSS